MYPRIRLTLTPEGTTEVEVSDGDGNPRLSFDPQLGCFIRVLPDNANLGELVKSKNWEIREAVARHRSVTPELLSVLAGDPVSEVRTAALLNPRCPVHHG